MADQSDEIHDFDNTVVAILDRDPALRDAEASLTAAGYEIEVLRGQEGKEHLDPTAHSGTEATIKRLLNAFGDQDRILERLGKSLDEGHVVISVDSKPDDADQAINILRDHGGEYIWKLGTWTFTRIGE
jgi:hypothetical protein